MTQSTHTSNIVDLLVIGGGINGTGIAADAAGRGLSVILCEKADLASGTSSASTKLIHGGLRYLENYEFKLVRHALQERSTLLHNAPHLIRPLRFVIPLDPQLRPNWLVRAGLFFYDHLAAQHDLPRSEMIDLTTHVYGAPLQPHWNKACVYSDCWVDDARLVVLNALAAKQRGAQIWVHHEFLQAERVGDHWQARVKNLQTLEQTTVTCRGLINAGGPWVETIRTRCADIPATRHIEHVKGSHIVVPRFYDGEQAYLLQQRDGRIIFVIPYETHYTLVGTTEIPYTNALEHVQISPAEIEYLYQTLTTYFKVSRSTIPLIWSYAGVRPLIQAPAKTTSALSRDYALELNTQHSQNPLLTVYGGKITTYRRLAEDALNQLQSYFPNCGPAWTQHSTLPGADHTTSPAQIATELREIYPWLPDTLITRYIRSYGTLSAKILTNCHSLNDLGIDFGAGLYERELQYLVAEEWATTAEDILWRRTKLGLHCPPQTNKQITEWLARMITN